MVNTYKHESVEDLLENIRTLHEENAKLTSKLLQSEHENDKLKEEIQRINRILTEVSAKLML